MNDLPRSRRLQPHHQKHEVIFPGEPFSVYTSTRLMREIIQDQEEDPLRAQAVEALCLKWKAQHA